VQKCGKILRGEKILSPHVVSTLRGRAPPPFRHLWFGQGPRQEHSDFYPRDAAVVVNALSARTVASLSSDRDQWLASSESQWEHCCYRGGGAGRSIWYMVDLVDVSM